MHVRRAPRHRELSPSELRWKCDPALFDFQSTANLDPIDEIIGQERALEALKLGVNIKAPGYNIYISGLSGTGKATTVQRMLESISDERPKLYDYVYVNNFDDPDRPMLLVFAAGSAKEFKKDMASFVDYLLQKIPVALESETYNGKRKTVIEGFKQQERKLFDSFQKKIGKEGFVLGEIKVGETVRPEIVPVVNNNPVPIDQLGKLIAENVVNKETAESLVEKYEVLREEMVQIFKKGMKINLELQKEIENLERDEISGIVVGAIQSIADKYSKLCDEKLHTYLENVGNNVFRDLRAFKERRGEENGGDPADSLYPNYEVNIVLDNSNVTKCPVVVETSPSYTNLLGTIEKVSDGRGGWYADFTKIKAGSLLKANGGYIVLRALHLFEEPGVWRMLKRILIYRKMEIQDSPYTMGWSQSMLKPEPIEIDTKVILIGNNYLYHMLSGYQDDFKKVFKVKADFDYEVKSSGDIMVKYARVIKKIIEKEKLPEFDKTAIGYLLELAARYAGQKQKLTTRFSYLADIAREASYWAKTGGAKSVKREHVKLAYDKGRERHSLGDEKFSENILDETILIETAGERVGCVNGLAVIGNDVFSFGKPMRITATAALGNGSIVNVEREAGLSGKIHDKGMLIITGFFRETFGGACPLSFTANIVFEQSYGGVDGDSASAAEVFALLSALASLPLSQSLAVTGSVNQKGEIQPIGGVNEKIEGFFDVCQKRGLTKKQGVIIPHQNVKDLMLRDEVIAAVKKRAFHIYPIKRIEEGVELLTGAAAGSRDEKGHFQKGTVFGLVEEHLKRIYEKGKNPFPKKDEKHKHTANRRKPE